MEKPFCSSVENALIAAALAVKGGPGSGNWGHTSTRRTGQIGGSDPGGGLGAIGVDRSATVQQRRQAAQAAQPALFGEEAFTLAPPERGAVAGAPRFKTNDEAAEWVMAQGLAQEVYFQGLDVRACQDIADSLADTAARIPKFKGLVRRIGNNRELNARLREERRAQIEADAAEFFPKPEQEDWRRRYVDKHLRGLGYKFSAGSYAMAIGDQIYVSQEWNSPKGYDRLREQLKEDVAAGWHPPGTGAPRSNIDHEIAHVLDHEFHLSGAYRGRHTVIHEKLRQASKEKRLPSKYAGHGYDEAMAEAWSEYVNSPNPGQTATEVGKRMLVEINEKRKRLADYL